MITAKLVIGSTNTVTLTGLVNTQVPDGDPTQYPVDANVVVSLVSKPGMIVIPGAENLPMVHVAGTAGIDTAYETELTPEVCALLKVQLYYAKVTATDNNGKVRVFYLVCQAVYG